jgi:hypothetical protein
MSLRIKLRLSESRRVAHRIAPSTVLTSSIAGWGSEFAHDVVCVRAAGESDLRAQPDSWSCECDGPGSPHHSLPVPLARARGLDVDE